MKVICTSPSFAKYDDAPISALKEADLELVMLPADASTEMLAQHLPDAIAMIVAFTDINESLLEKRPGLKLSANTALVWITSILTRHVSAIFLSLTFRMPISMRWPILLLV